MLLELTADWRGGAEDAPLGLKDWTRVDEGRWMWAAGAVLTGSGSDARFVFDREIVEVLLSRGAASANGEELERIALELNGGFAFGILERTAACGRLTFRTDRMGQVSVYTSLVDNGRRLVAGTSAMEVARAAQAELNVDAAMALLAIDFVPGRQCLADGVEQTKPAEECRFNTENGLYRQSVRRNWRMRVPAAVAHSAEDLEAELASVLNQVAEDWSTAALAMLGDGQVAGIPLSGGLDSRILACLFQSRLESRVVALCYGDPLSDDVRLSQRAAGAIRMIHRLVPFENGDFLNSSVRRTLAEAIGLTTRLTLADGGLALARAYGASSSEGTRDVGLVLPGHSGDGISGSKTGHPELGLSPAQHVYQDAVNHYWTGFRPDVLAGLLNEQTVTYAHSAEHLLRENCEALDQDSHHSAVQQWTLEELVHRRVLPEMDLYRGRTLPLLPFFDLRVIRFFEKVPGPLLMEQRVYRGAAVSHLFRGSGNALLAVPLHGKGRLHRPGTSNFPGAIRRNSRRVSMRILRTIAPVAYDRRVVSCPMMAIWRTDKAFRESVWSDIRDARILPRIFRHDRLLEYLEKELGRNYHLTALGLWNLLTVELAGRALEE